MGDEEIGATDDALAQAYQENAAHAAETTELWSNVSTEANQHLGGSPGEK